MILKLFKGQQPLVFIVLPALLLATWLFSGFHYFTLVADNKMPLYSMLFSIVQEWPSWLTVLLGFIITGSQCFHLNLVLNKHEVLNKATYLPALVYFIFASFLPQFVIFHPVLLVNSILIFVLDKIMKLYKNTSPLAIDFDICFLIGIAALFYFPALLFSLVFFISLTILKPFSWRDWIIGPMGLILPFFFVFVYYFLTDQLQVFSEMVTNAPLPESILIKNIMPKGYQVTITVISMLLVLAMFNLRNNFYKNDIKTRNYQQVIVIFIIVSVICSFLTKENMLYKLSVIFIPLTVVVSNFLLSIKKNWVAESLFVVLFLTLVFNYLISY